MYRKSLQSHTASKTITVAYAERSAAMDSPPMPPPMIKISAIIEGCLPAQILPVAAYPKRAG
jgi:hypothetical protein